MFQMNQLIGFTGNSILSASLIISTTQLNLDLLTWVKSTLNIDGKAPLNLVVTNAASNIIGSSSTGTYALTIQNFAVGSTIKFINKGYIVGAGGSGGAGGTRYSETGNGGSSGGPAILIKQACLIDNLNGTIGGGGGGGGGGACGFINRYQDNLNGYPSGATGGGGAGYAAGSGQNSGTLTSGGSGAGSGFSKAGGTGGSLGSAGAGGTPRTDDDGNITVSGGAGGAGGYAIVGNSYVTWINTGIVRGTLVA